MHGGIIIVVRIVMMVINFQFLMTGVGGEEGVV